MEPGHKGDDRHGQNSLCENMQAYNVMFAAFLALHSIDTHNLHLVNGLYINKIQ